MSSFFIERDSVYMSTLHMSIVGTPGPGYPLLLSLGKSLVVIVNYALNNRAAGPLWSGAILSRQTAPDPLPAWKGSGGSTYPGGSPQPKQLEAPDLPRSPGPSRSTGPLPGPGPGPSYTIRTPQRSRTYTPPGAGPEPPRVMCPHAGAGTRAGPQASTGRLAYLPHSMQ